MSSRSSKKNGKTSLVLELTSEQLERLKMTGRCVVQVCLEIKNGKSNGRLAAIERERRKPASDPLFAAAQRKVNQEDLMTLVRTWNSHPYIISQISHRTDTRNDPVVGEHMPEIRQWFRKCKSAGYTLE